MASLVALGLLGLPLPALAQAQAAQQPAPCSGPESRQFDFFVGDWDAFNVADNSPAGTSHIERLYNGCTIRENWSEPGLTGGSLNTYVARDHRWHQTWTDSSGAWREFVGGMEGGKMVMVWSHPSMRFPGKTALRRMTFTPNPDGTVRQYADDAADGEHWVESYDILYRRHSNGGGN